MQLIDLRTEVLNHGFDPNVYGSRINQYLNDAQYLVARRCDYWVNEAVQPIATVQGTATYQFPTNLARVRELFSTDLNSQIQPVGLRRIDQSNASNGRPYYYALDGANIHLYPTPDNVYNLELRYWSLPTTLVNDTDIPNLPVDWHHLLWVYAVWICYEADDDSAMGQYWQQRFNTELSEFEADQKFLSTEFPYVAGGMWDSDDTLSPTGGSWVLYGGYG